MAILAAHVAHAEPTGAGDAAPGPMQAPLRYRVVVDAPKAIADTIASSVDLIRWQDYPDMSRDLFDRLRARAVDQAWEAAAVEGYFSATVKITLDDAADEEGRSIVRVAVSPGEPARIATLTLAVTGPAADDPTDGAAAIAKARRDWLLPVGSIFRQASWDAAKQRAVATIAASPYAAAKLGRTEALVDPSTGEVALTVEIASGPPFYVGAIEITGLARYDAAVVRNFATLAPGERYDEARLDQFVRRVSTSGYFSSVQARIEPDPATAAAAVVRVNVIEAPPKRLEGGIGYSTDTEIRASLRYTNMDFAGRAVQMSVDGRLDTKIQSLGVRFVRPPTASGYLDSFAVTAERTDIEGLETRTGTVGVRRQTIDERDNTAYSATFYEDDQLPSGAPSERSRALVFDIERTWRRVDDLIAPQRGYAFSVLLGGAPPGVSTQGFGRAIVRFASWLPAAPDVSIDLRAEAGAVLAPSRDGIPSAMLFRTGGDTTVRGYDFDSLGVKEADATVGGRYYAVASIEAIRWIGAAWGLAAFADAGNANDDLAQWRPVYGYGVGLRVRSPIGPFRLDVAYGQESRQVHLHLSVGLSF